MARWTTPFCSGDSRQAGLLYLAAGYRNTTSLCSGASSANRILLSALLCVQLRLSSHFTCQPESWDRAPRQHGNSVQKSTSRLWMAKKFLDSIGGGGYNRILFNLPHDRVREETMDFIERIFGLAPDGGSGSLEFLLFLIPLAGLTLLIKYRRASRKQERPDNR